jgi:succinoglycan biosynthesis protein ExoA
MNAPATLTFDISVLIAVKNEAKHLRTTLDGLCEQLVTSVKIEVLVIDGSSADETLLIAKSYLGRLPNLRILHNAAELAAAGWNLGLANAEAPFVMILSGHAKLPFRFFERILEQLTPERAGAGGMALPIGYDARSSIIASAFSSSLGNGGAAFMQANGPSSVETIAFGCYRRSVLLKLGGFDERIVRGQDWDLNLRLRLSGQTLWLDPSLKIEYSTRSDFYSLWRL